MLNEYLAAKKNESRFLLASLKRYKVMIFLGVRSLLIIALLEVVPPFILKDAVDGVGSLPSLDAAGSLQTMHRLYIWAGLFLFVMILQAFARYSWRMNLTKAGALVGRDLREEYVSHLFKLSQSFFDRKPVGDLVAISTNDIEYMRQAVGEGIVVLADAFFI